MNLLHLKYAVEVAKAGSLNKASQTLLIGQPNLSRAIRELECFLGIKIFVRTAQGMQTTADGRQFLKKAEKILHEIDSLEEECRTIHRTRQTFSLSVPRASYISDAFIRFSLGLEPLETEIDYDETNTKTAIENILENRCNLAIIRFAVPYSGYFDSLLEEKDLAFTEIGEFAPLLVMSAANPLADRPEIFLRDLEPLIEIAHADPYIPALSAEEARNFSLSNGISRRIFVYERGSQFELLSENRETFMWVSSIPQKHLDRFGLVQRQCADNDKRWRDVLIFRKGYRFSALDKAFLQELRHSAREQNIST